MIGKGTALVRWLLIFLVLLPVRFYQLIMGPLLPKVCPFEPSCSDYFIQAVTKHGPVRGTLKGSFDSVGAIPSTRVGMIPREAPSARGRQRETINHG